MDKRVENAIKLMRAHVSEELPSAIMAQHLNLSVSRFRTLFRKETGVPFNRYLRSLRLECARRILESTWASVKEAMASAGLRDESHFVRDFTKEFGTTPLSYRNQSEAEKMDTLSNKQA